MSDMTMSDMTMSDMTGEMCACLTVQFKPREHENGSKTERWVCRDCGREFRPAIEPGELSPMVARIIAGQVAARGDIETLLRLMRANGVTRYRAGDLEIELAPATAVERIWREVPTAPQHFQLAAEKLWQLLDNIDTADDRCRDDDAAFRRAAMSNAKGRSKIAQSLDGHTLTWHWQRDAVAEQLGKAAREAGYPQRVPVGRPEPDEPMGKCLKSVAMGLCAREHGHTGRCSRGDAPPAPEPPDEKPAVEIDFAATEELLRLHDERRRGPSA